MRSANYLYFLQLPLRVHTVMILWRHHLAIHCNIEGSLCDDLNLWTINSSHSLDCVEIRALGRSSTKYSIGSMLPLNQRSISMDLSLDTECYLEKTISNAAHAASIFERQIEVREEEELYFRSSKARPVSCERRDRAFYSHFRR